MAALIVRKLRLQRGWTQEQLAELADLSTRSIQRIERGRKASIETLNALAAVFEVDLSVLRTGGDSMNSATEVSADENEAIGYVRGIKEFYSHLLMFLLYAVCSTLGFGMLVGLSHPVTRFMLLTVAGWAIGVVVHGLSAYEVIRLFGPKWERKRIEERLGRKL